MSDPRAMPLDAFTEEVMGILEHGPIENGEILVERVKPMRWAEKNGSYQDVLEMLASMHDEVRSGGGTETDRTFVRAVSF